MAFGQAVSNISTVSADIRPGMKAVRSAAKPASLPYELAAQFLDTFGKHVTLGWSQIISPGVLGFE
jgi:hypothetical protein